MSVSLQWWQHPQSRRLMRVSGNLHKVIDMLPLFFFLMLLAVGSILISLKASHEISRILAGGCAIFCGIFGFALAPWPIQLLIVALLLGLERMYPFRRLGEVRVTLAPNKRR